MVWDSMKSDVSVWCVGLYATSPNTSSGVWTTPNPVYTCSKSARPYLCQTQEMQYEALHRPIPNHTLLTARTGVTMTDVNTSSRVHTVCNAPCLMAVRFLLFCHCTVTYACQVPAETPTSLRRMLRFPVATGGRDGSCTSSVPTGSMPCT
jgi:hypothetical protein